MIVLGKGGVYEVPNDQIGVSQDYDAFISLFMARRSPI